MFIGVDCGTQGTKVLICDSRTHCVVGSGYTKHDMISDNNGRREQQVSWWIEAFLSAFNQAKEGLTIDLSTIKAIGISGQQHGMVLLDKFDNPLHPAKLWCDTETASENQEIIELMGGAKGVMSQIGIMLQTGYTASKILWFKKNHPESYAKIDKIMLPHDYLNYWLTGQFVSEYGDASGTGYLNVKTRQYDEVLFSHIAPGLSIKKNLPKLIEANTPIGKLKPEVAEIMELSPNTLVASGGGDNMMGAIGTGNIKPGIVTMSLGTSGTLYAYSDTPMQSGNDLLANFCSSSNGWLPLICTMNVTASTTLMQQLFKIDINTFTEYLSHSEPGAQGITLLPFFNGERVPALPNATAALLGLTNDNATQANIIRATTEAATFTLRYGLDIFRQEGIIPTEIRLIGGGSKNPVWRQMVADVMNTPVVCPFEHEAAALGGAIQAKWVYEHSIGNKMSLAEICDGFVGLDEDTRAEPIIENIAKYETSYQRYLSHLVEQYG
ncbi:xylulokinase [Thorsellia anophelis]|uniref:Xylulose kinase n=1 Tax=Thorsellia anophelis DSM 18579 TaxID=1123402 RepID=A0A1I0F6S3_9GAMM|nr:xylulokinase [Thorsellia anophelis]SET53539.1 xylulokinase [Thorsellia anophelis DSM 18579]